MAGNGKAYDALVEELREIGTIRSCSKLLGWDQEVFMPPRGAEIRARQLSLLNGMAHRRMSAPRLGELIGQAEAARAGEAPDSPGRATLREARRDHEYTTRIPAELIEERTRATTLGRRAWVDARKADDFEIFRPWFETQVDIARRMADAIGYEEHPYDALLDRYEPGATARSLKALFEPLRDSLVALLDRILGCGREVDTAPLHRTFPQPAQRELSMRAAKAIGFDFERGRLDPTAHPFCSGTGPDDVRLTTRYNETFFNEAFFSVLHEAGHGIYEQGLSAKHHGTPLGTACSYAIHESQSRLWENFVGRGRAFWDHFFPATRQAFPEALSGVGADDFWRAVNDVRPSLIRVEADEVTYNLHIFLRFELELALLSGDLAVADVPTAWNEATRRTLRIEVPNDADGCLQDVHWSAGYLGYFPTYAMGNVYAAQIHAAADHALGGLDAQFRKGEFQPLLDWLTQNILTHGRRYRPEALMERATGAPPSPKPLLDHLERKFGEIYGL